MVRASRNPIAGSVGALGEVGLLDAIAKLPRSRSVRGVEIGIGDDAAVLKKLKQNAVLSTDMLVEGVDFDLAWATWAEIGHKAAAANLSDLAAMGATPRATLLCLALRPHDRVRNVLQLVRTVAEVAGTYGAPLVGGDLSGTGGPVVVSVTVVGEAHKARLLRRHRAAPGDRVLVSGTLGGAALGLALMRRGAKTPGRYRRRQLRPEPRLKLGAALAYSGKVTAAADISDGLAKDALHLPREGCGVELDMTRLPVSPGFAALAREHGLDPLRLALAGGEDFELVVAAPLRHVRAVQNIGARTGVPLTEVGQVTDRPGITCVGGPAGFAAAGFEHFNGPKATV
ncbi:MAG: thiamine-phosphate kinase [Deltaproteobacteria bacterium]|nr:thiamine-phosphate kinase [Deltaproteobacteria bacterium]